MTLKHSMDGIGASVSALSLGGVVPSNIASFYVRDASKTLTFGTFKAAIVCITYYESVTSVVRPANPIFYIGPNLELFYIGGFGFSGTEATSRGSLSISSTATTVTVIASSSTKVSGTVAVLA